MAFRRLDFCLSGFQKLMRARDDFEALKGIVLVKNGHLGDRRGNGKSASGTQARESLACDRASGDALRVAPQVQDAA